MILQEQHHTSPTLSLLDQSRLPALDIACKDCRNSVWFASPKEVKCYCRVMYLLTWTTHEPGQIVSCDGTTLA